MSRRISTPFATKRKTCSGPRTRTKPAGPTWPTAMPNKPECRGCRPRASTRSSPSPATAALWEDLGNGYVTKKPKKKRTSVQVIAESEPDDDGQSASARQSAERRPGATHPLRGGRARHRDEPTAQGPDLHDGRASRELPGVDPPASTRPAIRSPGRTSLFFATTLREGR